MAHWAVICGTSAPPRTPNSDSERARTQIRCPRPELGTRIHRRLAPLLDSCESGRQFAQLHAAALKSDLRRHSLILSPLLRRCAALGAVHYSLQIFRRIARRNIFHYTAIVAGMLDASVFADAVLVYRALAEAAVPVDPVLVSYVLKACVGSGDFLVGVQVHAQALKLGLAGERIVFMRLAELYAKSGEFDCALSVLDGMPDASVDAVAATIMISSYCDKDLVDEAKRVFDGVLDRDVACWTAMIDGLVRNGQPSAALKVFAEMQSSSCVRPNELTAVCVLSACAQLGALETGRWIHSYIDRSGIRKNSHVGSALIDMYARCASLEDAAAVFTGLEEKGVVAYNAMIAALAMHGKSREAVELYKKMVGEEGLQPTPATFAAVLSACSHSGLAELGFEIFESMMWDHGVVPTVEHYGCVVDLLGRIGRLVDAVEIIEGMEKPAPDHVIWGSLLGACKVHGELELAKMVAGVLVKTGGANSGTYILLANTYTTAGKWTESAKMRAAMRGTGMEKEPGCSSIVVGKELHEFLAGDIRHPQREEIYQKLREVEEEVRKEGYLLDIGKDEKEKASAMHSERLAICYGLISTEAGKTIRVMKNLRVCGHCHAMIKVIAQVTKRRIIVRDRRRFHHFENGTCSCGDYW